MTRSLISMALVLMMYSAMAQQKIELNTGWTFCMTPAKQWMDAQVPGCVQLDLLRNGKIPDPLVNDNEKEILWVEDSDWTYKRSIKRSDIPDGDSLLLEIHGLAGVAEVRWNGVFIGEHRSAFFPFQHFFSRGEFKKENELNIQFRSTYREGLRTAKGRKLGITAGNDSREPKIAPYLRMPPYHFGWDWGPRLLSVGITESVLLRSVEHELQQKRRMKPHVELRIEKDSIGTSFEFYKDNVPIFVKGANYIPMSMYRSEPSDQDYRWMLTQVKESGFNMLRIWGGGWYEKDIFYEICDELDIMVWHDFMFAGCMYPDDQDFLYEVSKEVAYQTERLAAYDCVVLWCGNNEVDVAWQNWGWQGQLQTDSATLQESYDKLFKEIIGADSETDYIHSSPLSNWGKMENFDHLNMHYWGVWHGPDDFDGFEKYVPRFMSEYGFQSFPMPHTFKGSVDKEQWQWQSKQMRHRQKSYKGTEELIRHLEQHYPMSEDFLEFCYLTQLNQALAMEMAINAHRGSDGHCQGTLYWQLNDVWAGPTWSTIDYKGNWKVAHYTVADRYKDIIVIPKKLDKEVELRVANDLLEERPLQLRADLIDFNGDTLFSHHKDFTVLANGDMEVSRISHQMMGLNKERKKSALLRCTLTDDNGIVDSFDLYFAKPKDLRLPKVSREDLQIESIGINKFRVTPKKFMKDLFFYTPTDTDQRFTHNAIDLLPNEQIDIEFKGRTMVKKLRALSLNGLMHTQ